MKIKFNTFQWSALAVVITHLVGVAGFLSPYRDYFIMITPLHLLISTGLLIANQLDRNKNFYTAAIVAYLVGFWIEVAGINTGLIFGDYAYDTALGYKVFDTPLMIGVNWMMLIISIGAVFSRLNTNWFVKSIVSAIAMTALDYLIEPVAIVYDFWHWNSDSVPFQNYLAWLITSFVLFAIYYRLRFDKDNPLGVVILAMQIAFFGLLNLFG
jgi:bisanhydrobacterioruberin hydratase